MRLLHCNMLVELTIGLLHARLMFSAGAGGEKTLRLTSCKADTQANILCGPFQFCYHTQLQRLCFICQLHFYLEPRV